MAEHSKLLSPSASGLWTICTAMPQALLDSNLGGGSSAAADRGTLQHHYAEQRYMGKLTSCPGDLDFNEWEEVETAVESIEEHFKGCSNKVRDYLEMAVGFSGWRADCFGTADVVRVDIGARMMHVLDYKFGMVAVAADNNSQLLTYANAAIETFERQGVKIRTMIDHIVIGIAQPKLRKDLSKVMYTLETVLAWDRDVLQPAQRAVLEGNGKFKTGAHCAEKYCKFRKACEAAKQEVEDQMDEFMDLYNNEKKVKGIIGLPAEELSKFMKAVPLIRAICEDAEACVQMRLEQEIEVPEFKLVHGRGKREWANEEDADKFLTGKVKAEEKYKKTLITAPQAEKLLKEKLKVSRTKKAFDELVTWKDGPVKVAHESDPRPAIVKKVEQEEVDADVEGMFSDLLTEDFSTETASADVTPDSDIDDLFDNL